MNEVFGSEVDAALRNLTEKLRAESEELRIIIDLSQQAGASEAEVMSKILGVVARNPGLARRVEVIATEALAPLRGENLPASGTPYVGPGLVVPGPSGHLRLNPLYDAAIQERVHLDGDIPKLRTGAMPRGATPAVPVASDARDPVALGWMLEAASETVASETRAIEEGRAVEVAALLDGGTPEDTVMALREPAALALLDRNTLPDPVGYERGKLPTPREVDAPSGSALASLSPEQRGQLAWRFLSTTQGRRSATQSIRELVALGLQRDGHEITLGDDEPGRVKERDVLAFAEWGVEMGGAHSTQSSFAFIDTASRVLTKKLGGLLGDASASGARLEVLAVNAVDVRRVGWAARLIRGETLA